MYSSKMILAAYRAVQKKKENTRLYEGKYPMYKCQWCGKHTPQLKELDYRCMHCRGTI